MLTEIFLSFVVTSGVGAILVMCRLLYKSKCKNFELCCMKIERDAQEENHADLVIDMARRLSNTTEDNKPEKVVRFENIYKNELYKTELPKKNILDNKKGQDTILSGLEEGLSASIT